MRLTIELQFFFLGCWVLMCTMGAHYALRGIDCLARSGSKRNRRVSR